MAADNKYREYCQLPNGSGFQVFATGSSEPTSDFDGAVSVSEVAPDLYEVCVDDSVFPDGCNVGIVFADKVLNFPGRKPSRLLKSILSCSLEDLTFEETPSLKSIYGALMAIIGACKEVIVGSKCYKVVYGCGGEELGRIELIKDASGKTVACVPTSGVYCADVDGCGDCGCSEDCNCH